MTDFLILKRKPFIIFKIFYKLLNLFYDKNFLTRSTNNSNNSNNSTNNSKTQRKDLPSIALFDLSNKSGTYIITSLSLDKYYIGVSNNVTSRLNAHKSILKRNCHQCAQLQKDFNMYGEDQFVFKKLLFGVGQPKNKLEELETIILTTLPPEKRYNIYTNWRLRGKETNPFFGKQHTLEARQAQSDAKKGKPSPFVGKNQSQDVKMHISQINSGVSSQDRRKPLYIDNQYYESISDASSKTKMCRALIRKHCNSEEGCFENYKWAT